MTVRECYESIESDFGKVMGRLGSEALVRRFAMKFAGDPSFRQLKDALAAKDGETAFRAAHTLKGVCLNLGFDRLFETDRELTELLRGGDQTGWEPLFARVEADYKALTVAIRELAAES